jgi:hypothetical protein
MTPTESFFVIGGRYRNRVGTYEVLDLRPDEMRIRYDDRQEQIVRGLGLQERIVRNVEAEAETISPYGINDQRNRSLFRTVGFLTRRVRIEAIVPATARHGFEEHYQRVKGVQPTPGVDMYYLHVDPNVDKWGSELRVSFRASREELSGLNLGVGVEVVEGHGSDERRINNNGFVWWLFRIGFALGEKQDMVIIRQRIPASYQADFENGYRC